jgi:hypothetical protein
MDLLLETWCREAGGNERRIGSGGYFLSAAVAAQTGAGRLGDDWLLSDQTMSVEHQFTPLQMSRPRAA